MATKNTKDTKIAPDRPLRGRRRAWIFVALVLFAADPSLRGAGSLSAQPDITDRDLERASGPRTVAVRGLTGGRVEHVPLEVYVARVLAGEGEPGAPEATQQALAVAIRTYALFNAGRHRRDGFDLCDTTHCQVPRPSTAAARRAAMETAGRILTYQGVPAEIFYSASCGGRSEAASAVWPAANLPYLRSVEDDVHDADPPWTLEVTLDEVQRMLRRNGFRGSLKEVQIASRTASGRVATLRVPGLQPAVLTGDQLRQVLGATRLRSTAFSVAARGRTLRFTGRGYGHGVGMCVIGAGRRARRGEGVEAILAQYYPGLVLRSLDGVPAAATRLPAAPSVAPAPRVARAAPPAAGVIVRVPDRSLVRSADLEALVIEARDAMSSLLGVAPGPVTIELHDTIDSFRAATNRSWWVSAVARGSRIDVAPPAVVAQHGTLEFAVRVAVAEALMAPAVAGRPAWVRAGGARYFARRLSEPAAAPADRVRCPSDVEVLQAVSAAAQREADSRAESCFARAYADEQDWRRVR